MTEDTKFTLHEVAFSKEQIMQLTKPELELMLRLGLAVNELLLFQRIVGLITNSRPGADAAQDMWLAQLVTALMCTTGKVFEALEVFRKHFLGAPLGRELRPTLSQETQAAVEVLRALGGRDSLLANIRNLYSFHFHNDEDLSPYLDHLAGDAQLSLYYGLCDANTVHHFAVESLVTSFMRTTEARSGEEAIVRVVNEIQAATQAFHKFVMGVEERLFQKIGPLRINSHSIDAADVGVIEQQRFPTLIRPGEPVA